MAGNFTVNVNTQTLRSTADRMNSLNAQLDDKLAEINRRMNETEADWESEGATVIRQAMNNLKPRFERYKNVVSEYEKFLRETAQSYESTESAIKSNADAFM